MRIGDAGTDSGGTGTGDGAPAFIPVHPNLALGLFKGFPYQEQEMTLEAGTSLLLYTDGVTEAEDPAQQFFSDERLLSLLAREARSRPAQVVERLMQAIRTHAAEAEQNDDITILCLNYEPCRGGGLSLYHMKKQYIGRGLIIPPCSLVNLFTESMSKTCET